jgi:hypothetical protein
MLYRNEWESKGPGVKSKIRDLEMTVDLPRFSALQIMSHRARLLCACAPLM